MSNDVLPLDPGALAAALQRLATALTRHAQVLRRERELLEPRIVALMDVFKGRAAEDFHERWIRSAQGMDDDDERLARIVHLVEGKAGTLTDADRLQEAPDA